MIHASGHVTWTAKHDSPWQPPNRPPEKQTVARVCAVHTVQTRIAAKVMVAQTYPTGQTCDPILLSFGATDTTTTPPCARPPAASAGAVARFSTHLEMVV